MTESVAIEVAADPAATWLQDNEEPVRLRDDSAIETYGFRLGRRPSTATTLQRLENPLGSDGAYYLRRYLQQFPTRTDRQILRDKRDQFLARLEGVAR